MVQHITHDASYDTVDRDAFPVMMDVGRYNRRTDAFDQIISATHDHFWDPLDAKYVDYTQDFDLENEYLMPPEQVPELTGAVYDRLDEGQRIRLANESTRWGLSSILHGEQGALSLSASLCHILVDPGAQEYATNQAREEARHVTGFAKYIGSRWGTAYPVGDSLGSLMNELVMAPEVYKKLVGMQMLIEGLAMGAFANLHRHTNDPVLKRLVQLVMTDEAFHHRFGKIWADRTIPKLSEKEHEIVETWAAKCFETLLFNLTNIRQKREIYPQFGLEWEWVRDSVREVYTDRDAMKRNDLRDPTNIMRVLVKTLLNAGIITERTRPLYANWIDIDDLEKEEGLHIGEAIAADGMEFLKELNKDRRVIGQKPI
ncbi:ferritin-like domain-containing protein [Minwuia sp.]|uniref:ferritin-like domain-containing protein n=1 Tax=Minwuia sp. TaxID=2493630 RepID=UPI003A902E35